MAREIDETECACDACDVVFGPHDAKTPDGYCAFCARSCYPMTEFRGRRVRSALGRVSRRNLHAMARVAEKANSPAEAAEAARREAAEAAVDILGPAVERGGRMLVDFVRRKIRGSGSGSGG